MITNPLFYALIKNWKLPLACVGLAVLIFGVCLLGILMRPIAQLSSFWLANAVLAGVMVRVPLLQCLWGWLAAMFGFVSADLITGTQLQLIPTLWFSVCNLSDAAVAAWVLLQADEPTRRLQSCFSMLLILGASCISGLVGSLLACIVIVNYFNSTFEYSILLWFSGELFNMMAVLPIMLTASLQVNWREWISTERENPHLRHSLLIVFLTLFAVIISESVSHFYPGPGSLIYSAPALILCALTWRTFPCCVLISLISCWRLILMIVDSHSYDMQVVSNIVSLKVGISLMATGPLAVVCATAVSNTRLNTLKKLATFDHLTGVFSRGAFLTESTNILRRLATKSAPVAVMMLDIDYFKKINDLYGHAAGDDVLKIFSKAIAAQLRKGDLFGRLGGEEFAVLLPETNAIDAEHIAQRLIETVRNVTIPLSGISPSNTPFNQFTFTVSVGVISYNKTFPDINIEMLLSQADMFLYSAKNTGRDKLVIVEETGIA